MSEMITGTRVYGKFSPDEYRTYLAPFVENASQFGQVVVVSQYSYPYLLELENYLAGVSKDVEVKKSKTVGVQSPADMCNQIVKACNDANIEYFGMVSRDLVGFIPDRFPELLKRMNADWLLASVGTAIQGVHNLQLLEKVKREGQSQITPDNFATVFHNNAFAIHRLAVLPSVEERLFPRITDQGKLGNVKIEGQTVPVGGNEEISLAFKLLAQGWNLKTQLVAGESTIIRDPQAEISSVDAKVLRRPAVARVYQNHYGLDDWEISGYLQKHFEVKFN